MDKTKLNGRIIAALILIILGVLLLLDNLYYINARYIISTYWPAVIIILGIAKMIRVGSIKNNTAIIMILTGLLFQLNRLDYLQWWQIERYWPAALIVIGVLILLQRTNRIRENRDFTETS